MARVGPEVGMGEGWGR